jgi:hypothetical protein
MSTLKVTTLQNLSGTEVYTAKAWVNFNGTGTVAIRASGNVSSITDNGTGDYTVNFTTALSTANYSATTASQNYASGAGTGVSQMYTGVIGGTLTSVAPTTTAVRLVTLTFAGSLTDVAMIAVTVNC